MQIILNTAWIIEYTVEEFLPKKPSLVFKTLGVFTEKAEYFFGANQRISFLKNSFFIIHLGCETLGLPGRVKKIFYNTYRLCINECSFYKYSLSIASSILTLSDAVAFAEVLGIYQVPERLAFHYPLGVGLVFLVYSISKIFKRVAYILLCQQSIANNTIEMSKTVAARNLSIIRLTYASIDALQACVVIAMLHYQSKILFTINAATAITSVIFRITGNYYDNLILQSYVDMRKLSV